MKHFSAKKGREVDSFQYTIPPPFMIGKVKHKCYKVLLMQISRRKENKHHTRSKAEKH